MLPDPIPDVLMECASSQDQSLPSGTGHLRTHRTAAPANCCNAIGDVFLRLGLKNGCPCRGSHRMHNVRQELWNITEHKLPPKAVSRSSAGKGICSKSEAEGPTHFLLSTAHIKYLTHIPAAGSSFFHCDLFLKCSCFRSNNQDDF